MIIRVEPVKIFECSCANSFIGDFCEFKTEQNHLLYHNVYEGFVFTDDAQLIQKSLTSSRDDNVGAYRSCFTMLNGEAVIFGGEPQYSFERQVTYPNYKLCLTVIHLLDICCFWMHIETTW